MRIDFQRPRRSGMLIVAFEEVVPPSEVEGGEALRDPLVGGLDCQNILFRFEHDMCSMPDGRFDHAIAQARRPPTPDEISAYESAVESWVRGLDGVVFAWGWAGSRRRPNAPDPRFARAVLDGLSRLRAGDELSALFGMQDPVRIAQAVRKELPKGEQHLVDECVAHLRLILEAPPPALDAPF